MGIFSKSPVSEKPREEIKTNTVSEIGKEEEQTADEEIYTDDEESPSEGLLDANSEEIEEEEDAELAELEKKKAEILERKRKEKEEAELAEQSEIDGPVQIDEIVKNELIQMNERITRIESVLFRSIR